MALVHFALIVTARKTVKNSFLFPFVPGTGLKPGVNEI